MQNTITLSPFLSALLASKVCIQFWDTLYIPCYDYSTLNTMWRCRLDSTGGFLWTQ